MSQYTHHNPGRIRVRSRAFRCRSERGHAAERRLKAIAGVRQVRTNPHAGSITVHCGQQRFRDPFSCQAPSCNSLKQATHKQSS